MGEQFGLKYLLKKADSLDAKYLSKRGKSIFNKTKSKRKSKIKSKRKSKMNKHKRQIGGKSNRIKTSKVRSKNYKKI